MDNKNSFQMIWAAALILMGVAIFFRVPVVVEKMAGAFDTNTGLYFFRFSFYLIAVILIGGGLKKIVKFWPSDKK
jgi:hypothetical protein